MNIACRGRKGIIIVGGVPEPCQDWLQRAPVGTDPVDQLGRVDELLEAVGLGHEELLVAQELDARVPGVVAAGSGLQRLATDLPTRLLEFSQRTLEFRAGPVVGDGVANGRQAFTAGIVEATSDAHAAGRDVDVEAGRRPGRHERTLVGLVGRLVLREPDVAVGAVDLGRPELRLELLGQRRHRRADGLVVHVLVCFPERPRVVHLEVVVEVQCGNRETRRTPRQPSVPSGQGTLAHTCSSPPSPNALIDKVLPAQRGSARKAAPSPGDS